MTSSNSMLYSTAIANSLILPAPTTPFLLFQLASKNYNTNGFQATYVLKIATASTPIDHYSRFYVEFAIPVGAGFNR